MSEQKNILVARPGDKAHMGELEVTVLEVRILSASCIKYAVSWVTSGVRYEQVIDSAELDHASPGLRSVGVGFRS